SLFKYDTMKKQHRRSVSENNFVSGEGQRDLLCCNKKSLRCPSLDFNSNSPLVSEDMAIDYLAGLIVDAYLYEKYHARNNTKENSSDILPGLNKGTSRRR